MSVEVSYSMGGLADGYSERLIIWAHGWGHNMESLKPLATAFDQLASSYFVDLPGFGQTPALGETWGYREYGDHMANFVSEVAAGRKVYWVGHSLGGGVGLQVAATNPGLLSGLCLVAGAGMRAPRSIFAKAKTQLKVRAFKAAKLMYNATGRDLEVLYNKHGSTDYRNAGSMRQVLVKVTNSDLSQIAANVDCPTLLIYGEDDTATPPSIGEVYRQAIDGAQLVVFPGNDHYSLIGSGRHLVSKKLWGLIDEH